VLALAVPSIESVDRFEQDFALFDKRRERLTEALEALSADEQRLAQERRELARGGEVPSVSMLEQARTEREHAWRQLESAWDGAAPPAAEKLRYFGAIEHADQIADRLRLDADRVARAESITSELAELEQNKLELSAKRGELEQQAAALGAEWSALWKPLGLEPKTPREMRGWLGAFARLIAASETWDERRRELERASELAARHQATLGRALGIDAAPSESLSTLVRRARTRIDAEVTRARQPVLL
jgi:hypothetical protein